MPRIEDYALIGDCETAALVGCDGSIDWLCLPRFDSDSCFAKLLGDEQNGYWKICPEERWKSERQYRAGTLTLETVFTTDQGRVRVTDLMPPKSGLSEVVRIVEGLEGMVKVRSEVVARFDHGTTVPWVSRLEDGAISMIAGASMLILRTGVAMRGEAMKTVGVFSVMSGQRVTFVLSHQISYQEPAVTEEPAVLLQKTEDFWRDWSSRCETAGPYSEAVLRSLITLKALTFGPSGGIVAAPTTSLPEQIGGSRNWNYRFCWVRDATLTLLALMGAGYYDEARAWRDWLVRAVAGSPQQLQIMYAVTGERRLAAGLVGGEGFAVDASLIAADANKQRSIAGQDWRRDRDPKRSSRAVKEYLATLDDTAWGAASDVVPKFVSPSDPAAQWTGAHKGPAFFAYSDNYLIDVKFGVIVDVEASRSIRQAEVGAAKTMIERTEERFGLKPQRLAADTAYGTAPMLNWLVEEKGIAPHIPVFDKSKRDDGTFSRSDFRYDPTGDVYHCPGGERLRTSGTVHEGKTLLYRASKLDCNVCPLKPQCCPKEPARKVPRDIHEHARDVARSLTGTEGFEQSRRERKKIEMRFAHLKRILRLSRLRLRGPRGAQDEFVLAAIAQNLRRLALLVARPPPSPVQCIA